MAASWTLASTWMRSDYGLDDGELKPGSPTTPYPLRGSTSGGVTTGPTARPTLGCVPGADPDSGATTAYCNCPGADSVLPTLTTGTDECGYTAIPFICQTKTDMDASSSVYCACNGYPGTLPLLSPTFTPYDPCGYTTIPDPFPFTSTDAAGDVIGCRSSMSSTECVAPSTTLYTAPPPPTSTPTAVPQYTFLMWREFDYEPDDAGGHVHYVLSGLSFWAGSEQNPCDQRGTYDAQDPETGEYLNGYSDSMLFKDGICGVGSNGILCTSSDGDKNWSCKNQGGIGNEVATCQVLGDTSHYRGCSEVGLEVVLIENLICTGDINCDA
ncbi:hypothetical protein F5Y14DRAFT_157095 [Nemania sp. NC0429]|nr:hypothetical protein F5Y14DRAFT_157095 [Nemania sp. NC0429]